MITGICRECAIEHGNRTPPQRVLAKKGRCEWCGEYKNVSDPKLFFCQQEEQVLLTQLLNKDND